PELYQTYETAEAVAFFEASGPSQPLCNGQWIIFPAAIVCMATLGEEPDVSHFQSGTRFRWVADQPYQVGRDPRFPTILPTEAIAGNAEGRGLYLFVRSATSQKYIYVGEMGPTHAIGHASKNNCGHADFDLSPALPSAVWTALGGLIIGDADHAAVDA